jgi:hypothetical protein
VIRAPVAPLASVALLVAAFVVACGSTAPTSTGPVRPTSAVGGSAGATHAPGSFGPPPSPSQPDDATPVALEPELLAFLPESIDGIPVVEDLDVAAEALLDPALARIATGVDAAVAVDTGTGNLVTAWVVRLRPDAFGDEAYRQWRDSYDEGACAAAGGVVGRAQAELGGRNTYVTSCVAALRTYHVWLEEQSVLVSASSIGEGRFGEKLMSTLRVPE